MQSCPYCGAPQEDGVRFCANCGQTLSVPQQPQYQQPVYQAPQYQVPSPHASHYRAAAKKYALIALILLGCAIALDFGALLLSRWILIGVNTILPYLERYWDKLLIPYIPIAILPVITTHCSVKSNVRSASLLQTCAIIFLGLQALSAVATISGYLLYHWTSFSILYDISDVFFTYVAGSRLLMNAFWLLFVDPTLFVLSDLLQISADLCFWGVNIFTMIAASKLKKA